jgi:hypothetical protein
MDMALAAEPTENADATQPTEPMDNIEPAEPIDRIEPDEPMDKMEPDDPMLMIDPDEPDEVRSGTLLMAPLSGARRNPAGAGPARGAQPDRRAAACSDSGCARR